MRVISTGVDTLTWTAPLDMSGVKRRELELARQGAASGAAQSKRLDGRSYDGRATGGSYAYRWQQGSGASVERSLLVDLLSPAGGLPSGVKAEIGSYACWEGLDGAVAHSLAAMRELTGQRVNDARVTRIDLCVDFQLDRVDELPTSPVVVGRSRVEREVTVYDGRCHSCRERLPELARFCPRCGWNQTRSDLPPEKTRLPLRDGLMPRESYRWARRTTGWQWGRGRPVMVRIYNKTTEIREHSPDKVWFHTDVWPRSPLYQPDETVWRCEAQIRGDALEQLTVPLRGQLVRLGPLSATVEALPDLWSWIVGEAHVSCSVCFSAPIRQRPPVGTAQRAPRLCPECGEKLRSSRGWLSMRSPTRTAKGEWAPTNRWPTIPLWNKLQLAEIGPNPSSQIWRRKLAAQRKVAVSLALGSLASIAAIDGGDSLHDTMLAIRDDKTQKIFLENVHKKRKRLPHER